MCLKIINERSFNVMSILALVIISSLLALGFAAMNFVKVKKLDEGTERMAEIASAIRIGASTFINYEYKILLVVSIFIFAALLVLVDLNTALAFVIGAVMSASAGYVGMKIATYHMQMSGLLTKHVLQKNLEAL